MVEHSKMFVDAAVLAMPETHDMKVQTHGPRKKAYYESIPPKVNTNLSRASPEDQFEYRPGTNIKMVRYKSVADKKISPEANHRKTTLSPQKLKSPQSAAVEGHTHREDAKSLRVQLQSLKAQLNDQEADNLTLIEKVTRLEEAIADHEKTNAELNQKLRHK